MNRRYSLLAGAVLLRPQAMVPAAAGAAGH